MLGTMGAWARLQTYWLKNTRAGGQVWTHNVEERMGSALALVLRRTPATPNLLTIVGLTLHIAVAAFVLTLGRNVSGLSVAVVAIGWQAAFAFDCADGQLARDKGLASPFGAWLDQLADFVSHLAVYLSLAVFLTRALRLPPVGSAMFAVSIFGASIFYLFATAQRNALLGSGGGIHVEGSRWLKMASSVRHLPDYGAMLLVNSILLLEPLALLIFLSVAAAVSFLITLGQIGYNWRRAGTDRGGRVGRISKGLGSVSDGG
jgi:phosphatidylglycerophosphate synthase